MSAPIQHAWGSHATDPVVVAFPQDLIAGNTILVGVISLTNDILDSYLSDTRGHTYVRDVIKSTNPSCAWFRVSNITGGACTVTYDFPGNATAVMVIAEFPGMAAAPLDGTGTGSSGVSTNVVTSDFSPSAPCTVVGLMSYGGATPNTIAQGSGFSLIDEDEAITIRPFNAEYKTVAAGTYHADWTLDPGAGWQCCAAAYLDLVVGNAGRPGGVRAGW